MKFKDNVQTAKDKIYNTYQNVKVKAKRFYEENKEIIIPAMIPVVIGTTKAIAKGLVRNNRVQEEKELKENYIYDRSAGHYWPLRRKLKTSEWIEIDTRRCSGERLYDILASMRVLR